jgi:NTE family protein
MLTYWLALGWWAARWICHIGVIQYIEENNIQIWEVTGTSMGAIIASCYAVWMTSREIQSSLEWINFLKLIDINLKEWIVSGEKVYKELKRIFWDKKIEETNIPLKIIATNIESGEKEVFTKGKIVDALRASISLPMIFTAHKQNGKLYVDGWLKANLPLLEIDSQNIIAVSAIRTKDTKIRTHKKLWNFEFKKWFWEYNYQILRNTIALIMMTNEDLSLKIWRDQGKNIILLTPDITKFEYYDFHKSSEIIKTGYKEAKEKLS